MPQSPTASRYWFTIGWMTPRHNPIQPATSILHQSPTQNAPHRLKENQSSSGFRVIESPLLRIPSPWNPQTKPLASFRSRSAGATSLPPLWLRSRLHSARRSVPQSSTPAAFSLHITLPPPLGELPTTRIFSPKVPHRSQIRTTKAGRIHRASPPVRLAPHPSPESHPFGMRPSAAITTDGTTHHQSKIRSPLQPQWSRASSFLRSENRPDSTNDSARNLPERTPKIQTNPNDLPQKNPQPKAGWRLSANDSVPIQPRAHRDHRHRYPNRHPLLRTVTNRKFTRTNTLPLTGRDVFCVDPAPKSLR